LEKAKIDKTHHVTCD